MLAAHRFIRHRAHSSQNVVFHGLGIGRKAKAGFSRLQDEHHFIVVLGNPVSPLVDKLGCLSMLSDVDYEAQDRRSEIGS